MDASGLDRNDDRPLYVQIRSDIHRQITSGQLASGQSLPTEEELQKLYGVSRSVVRQALSGLSEGGFIERQRGRGSVVASTPALRRHVQRAGGLEQESAAQGQPLDTVVIGLEASTAPEDARDALGTSRTWKLERLRLLNGTPMLFMRTWIPRQLFPHLRQESVENASLLDFMRSHGHPPAGGPRQIEAVLADDELAGRLDLSVGDPLLRLRGVTRDESGKGLEWFSVWHRPGTIFDVDAQVVAARETHTPPSLKRIRDLVSELDQAVGSLDS